MESVQENSCSRSYWRSYLSGLRRNLKDRLNERYALVTSIAGDCLGSLGESGDCDSIEGATRTIRGYRNRLHHILNMVAPPLILLTLQSGGH